MMYMIVERFRDGMKPRVYERFRQEGRMLPAALKYVASWIEVDGNRCYQLMEAESEEPFQAWTARWSDLVEFEIVPVDSSPGAEIDASKGQVACHRNTRDES